MVTRMLLESAGMHDPACFRQTQLYRQCVAAGVIPADAAALGRIHELERQETRSAEPMVGDAKAGTDLPITLTLQVRVAGMWCPACAWVVEKTVGRMDGVQEAACHFSTDRLRCRYRPDRVTPDQIRTAVARLGYDLRETDAGTADRQIQRRQLTRLAITGMLSANVMMLSWALYAGFFTDLSRDAVAAISLPIVAMSSVVFFYGGAPILRKAWFGLIHGAPGMEALVGMGAGCAFMLSLYNWLSGSIHLYFDTASMLITLVLLGKFMEQLAKSRVRRDLDGFFALQPVKVRLITDRAPEGRYVAIDHLSTDDRFAVEAGEIVPADGRVTSGWATVDESFLTGEPRPVVASCGVPVKCGSRLIDGRVIATTEQVGPATMLGQMIAIMARSLEQKGVYAGRTDRMLAWFVPIMLGLAAGTGLFAAWAGLSTDQAVVRAVTVMVVSCPCALGVAIPMARLAGTSLAGRQGVLVREIESFERAGDVDTIVFDKTGTLTHGRWQLSRVDCQPGYDPATIVAWAAGLEQASDHEVARSILAYADGQGVEPALMAALRVSSDGVMGRLGERIVRIGKREFAWPHTRAAMPAPKASAAGPASLVYLSIDGQAAATLHFGDRIRSTVPSMVTRLKKDFREIHLISGDDATATREVARAVGLTQARGGLVPAEKAAYIDALKDQGCRVAMVGDGVNDAAAMSRADLAVAVHAGAGLAKEAAHITLMRGDPAQLLDFFPLSHRVNRKVVQNLWCAWIYNLISLPVAMGGLLTPLVAATAMLLSSLTVMANTLLLIWRKN